MSDSIASIMCSDCEHRVATRCVHKGARPFGLLPPALLVRLGESLVPLFCPLTQERSGHDGRFDLSSERASPEPAMVRAPAGVLYHAERPDGRRVSHRYEDPLDAFRAARWRATRLGAVTMVVDSRGFVLGVTGCAAQSFRGLSRTIGLRNAEAYRRAAS